MNGKPCRCLLSEAGESVLAENVREYIMNLPPEVKTPEELYGKRLKKCGECTFLNSGMCVKCGCYVEMRAAVVTARCPSEERLW